MTARQVVDPDHYPPSPSFRSTTGMDAWPPYSLISLMSAGRLKPFASNASFTAVITRPLIMSARLR